MRDLRLALTLSASALLAGCAGPATKSDVVSAARVAAPIQALPSVKAAPPRVMHAAAALDRLRQLAPELDPGVLALALQARDCAVRGGQVAADARLAVVDYSQPSTTKRLWVFDVARDALLFHDYVTHGQGSGENVATRFSNREGSYATSLGLFRTAETYNWLASFLDVAMFQQLLPETAAFKVERYELPNLNALNFVVEGILGEGVASSTRQDPQAKGLGEWLRSRYVDIPEELMP